MRVFVTGATGFLGSAVVRELIDAGHEVVGLARSDQAAASLKAAGAGVHRGSLDDLDSLRGGVTAADGVVHTAFTNISASTDFAASCRADVRAIEAMGEALEGSGRSFVVTSVTALLPPGRLGTEDTPVLEAQPRAASEERALSFAARGVRVSAVRLPPSVHGHGDRGFVPDLIGIAHARGVSAYVGDGSNRWPAVHRFDAAELFRLALEHAPAGARLHAADDEGVPFRDIAGVVGRHLGIPVTALSPEEADGHFAWLARFTSLDNPVSSELTRKRLGWHPVRPALIPDLEEGHYFAGHSGQA
ncbi:SDR family oxidoreductase [Microbispora sitophila]|uniref:SDR family oxidoreductase n=1 Tax=Microbispora sitophila TaxID=2771537 RepID=UPI00299F550D|nr:SDR family oxidoreductase [Microbispora sitophila]